MYELISYCILGVVIIYFVVLYLIKYFILRRPHPKSKLVTLQDWQKTEGKNTVT